MEPSARPQTPAGHRKPAIRKAEAAAGVPPRDSLWPLIAGPTLWAVHFLLSYVTAAVWCAKVGGQSGPLGSSLGVIGLYTLVAVLGCLALMRAGWRRHRFGQATLPHDAGTTGDRHRFLGFATLLLAGLSLVAIIYVALPLLFIERCT